MTVEGGEGVSSVCYVQVLYLLPIICGTGSEEREAAFVQFEIWESLQKRYRRI